MTESMDTSIKLLNFQRKKKLKFTSIIKFNSDRTAACGIRHRGSIFNKNKVVIESPVLSQKIDIE